MTPRYGVLVLLLLVPAFAVAQIPDSIVVTVDGMDYGAWGGAFGPSVPCDDLLGPLPLIQVEGNGTTAPPEQGCDPFTNTDEIEGNIAFILRGSCAFVLKVQNASAAGAEAVVIYNDDRNGDKDESLVQMGGDCSEEDGCTVPAVFVSRRSGLEILNEIQFGAEATLRDACIDCCWFPPPPSSAPLNTGTVETTLFEDGFIGNDASFGNGAGFTFNGIDGLFVGTVLVGIDGEVSNSPYDGAPEFRADQDAAPVAGPYSPPYASFDQAARAVFSSDQVRVQVTGYADQDAPNDTFIPYDVAVTNISGGDLEDVYIGVFADWDAGTTTSQDDAGGFDAATNMPYVFHPVEETAYFGVSALPGASFSGYSTEATTADDAQLFAALTTETPPSPDPAARATVTGVGPYDLADGETRTARFAFVGGGDLTELLANAASAQTFPPIPSTEAVTPEGTYVLASVYPNPSSSHATVGFTLPRAQAVRLAVYDVLGREVAVLADGVRPAGEQTVTFEASGLGSGMYVVRLDAGGVHLTQRLIIIR